MRVIAGSLRGRRLTAPRGRERTRPTSDRVREATFALLGDVEGTAVLDLFAGTGALGIEALSRGAQRVLFVERDRAALQALRANLSALGLAAPSAEVRAGEALAALGTAQQRGETYDLVFVDPPYGQAGELAEPLSARLPAALEPAARVVVESDRRSPLALALAPLRERRYGDTLITIYGHHTPHPGERAPDRGAPGRGASGQGAPDLGASDRGAPDRGAPDRGASDRGAHGLQPGTSPTRTVRATGAGSEEQRG